MGLALGVVRLRRIEEIGGDSALLPLQRDNLLLHRISHNKPHDFDGARLADAVAAINSLLLNRRIPPRIAQHTERRGG